MAAFYLTFLCLVMSCLFFHQTGTSSVQLTSGNIDDILLHNEIVFINFYADWCRFSQMLAPIFDETATKLQKEYPDQGKVVLGKVDCDREGTIASQYHVSKYPTLKVFRYGQLVKREYRGQRSVDALSNFVKEQLRENLQIVNNMEEIDLLDKDKRNMIGYFENTQTDDWINFSRIASLLREDCTFYAAVGPVSQQERQSGDKIIFRPPTVGSAGDEIFTGDLKDYNTLLSWATEKCVPLVRVITFENAEELTEEGLPFLIMFHNPSDTETPDRFKNIVMKELLPEKNSINFLTADGLKFSHPLYHLGKSTNDLPVLAIDSFRHMYIWPHSIENDLEKPGLLKQFIADLHSGKLHREFHHGPDSTPAPDGASDDGNNALQVAAGNGGNHPPGTHYDIQQQVIIHNSGIQVRIMRVLHQGPHNGMKLPEKLALAEKELKNSEEKQKDSEDEGKEDVESPQEDKNLPGGEKDGDNFKEKIEEHIKRTAQETGYFEQNNNKPQSPEASQQQQQKEQETVNSVDVADKDYVVVESKSTKLKIPTPHQPDSTQKPKTVPESIFKKLTPSRDRYTFLDGRDEL